MGYAGAHFDYIASHPFYPKIVQAELMRARTAHSSHFDRMTNEYFKPLFAKLSKVVQEGIALGEFRRVDAFQTSMSIISLIVFYFSAGDILRMLGHRGAYSAVNLKRRKREVLDLVRHGLFIDPDFKMP